MSRSSLLLVLASLSLVACSSRSEDAGATPKTTSTSTPASVTDGGSDAASDGGDGGDDGGYLAPLIIEPDQGMSAIYALVSSATKTIDMTMYELTDTTFTGLLIQAAKNGVTVRVILDQNLEKTDNTPAYDSLTAGDVQVHWANPIYAVTHQKTITVDGTTSAIMTLNLSSIDYPTSRDFAVITTDPADVAAIEQVFGDDFTNTSVTPPVGDDLVWSPTNSQSSMVGLINGARATLLVENEEMSDDTIVSALNSAAARGVAVHVVMEDSSSYATEFGSLEDAGVRVVTYAHDAIYIHAKVILADYGTSNASVFIGSENFSRASLTENRELGLITSNPAIMTSINTTLTHDFGGGSPY